MPACIYIYIIDATCAIHDAGKRVPPACAYSMSGLHTTYHAYHVYFNRTITGKSGRVRIRSYTCDGSASS